MNGANCFVQGSSYLCDCFPGFSGQYCEVDPCVDSPCQYDTCTVDGRGSTFCDCPDDLDGQFCEIDACVSKICGNGGICDFDAANLTASCECQNGFSGENCEIHDACATVPCENNGRCIPNGIGFTCACVNNFVTGDFCEHSPCDAAPCSNNAECLLDSISTTGFICRCADGFYGAFCENDSCTRNPCHLGQSCILEETTNRAKCICDLGFSGSYCQHSVCDSQICLNGGYCSIETDGAAVCNCQPGFFGNNCELTSCSDNPCFYVSSDRCVPGVDSYVCLCPEGFSGDNCETSPCQNNPCMNDGICSLSEDLEVICDCNDGFAGDFCEQDICHPSPCINDGLCKAIDQNSFECECLPGYSGRFCQIDSCQKNECENDSTCIPNLTGFTCECQTGFYGPKCEFDSCSNSPCLYGAECTPEGENFTCDCPPRFSGNICQITPCDVAAVDQPCQNNATCSIVNQGIYCDCLDGFGGKYCTEGPCAEDPCLFDGRCSGMEDGDGFTCNCPDGYSGDRCQIIPCADDSHGCLNGGICNLSNSDERGYTCECTGWTGEFCEINPCDEEVNPCQSGSKCIQTQDEIGYRCDCSGLFDVSGMHCEITPCNTVDGRRYECFNGDCVIDKGLPTCFCRPGFYGKFCEFTPCSDHNCQNGGTCVIQEDNSTTTEDGSEILESLFDAPRYYTCDCELGFHGPDCLYDVCTDIQCENGGECEILGLIGFCECPEGFFGERCEQDHCSDTPCGDFGECTPLRTGFTCDCNDGYSGTFCEITPCQNDLEGCNGRGSCEAAPDGSGTYYCDCAEGFFGEFCEITPCTHADCGAGTCQLVGDLKRNLIEIKRDHEILTIPELKLDWKLSFKYSPLNVPTKSTFVLEILYSSRRVARPGHEDIISEVAGSLLTISTDPYTADFWLCTALKCERGSGSIVDQLFRSSFGSSSFNIMARSDEILVTIDGKPYLRHTLKLPGNTLYYQNFSIATVSDIKSPAEGKITNFHFKTTETYSGSTCFCPAGITGEFCENSICDELECGNGACEVDSEGQAFCTCFGTYNGTSCDTDLCAENPCQNGGHCVKDPIKLEQVCNCSDGFYGKNCESSICDIRQDYCQNGGECFINRMNLPECICPTGVSHGIENRCEISPCNNDPCGAENICNPTSSSSVICECKNEFTGQFCDISPCDAAPCLNGGVCDVLGTKRVCTCAKGYLGDYCERSICENIECENGGICSVENGQFKCNCKAGFSGLKCSVKLCDDSRCQNGGKCNIDDDENLFCECPAGYTGNFCESTPCDLLRFPHCQNEGICVFRDGELGCDCPAGITGEFCEKTPCSESPCNEGTCHVTIEDNNYGYLCECPAGFSGLNCEINPCSTNPCHHGSCVIEDDSYACACPATFSGPFCEINLCEINSFCQNGGTCVADSASETGFSCLCREGFRGEYCENDLCADDPDYCVNGWCSFENGEKKCECYSGWHGEKCERNPCQQADSEFNICNGGACFYAVTGGGSFYDLFCSCGQIGTGEFCEIDACAFNVCPATSHCVPKERRTPSTEITRVEDIDDIDLWNNLLKSELNKTEIFEEISPLISASPEISVFDTVSVLESGESRIGFSRYELYENNPKYNYICQCLPGYYGQGCASSPCVPNPCENRGTCVGKTDIENDQVTARCECFTGFTGDDCRDNVCADVACLNNGQCKISGIEFFTSNEIDPNDPQIIGRPYCSCREHFSGILCEKSVCSKNPCMNNGRCRAKADGSFTCTCAQGYSGALCENDPCVGVTECENGKCTVGFTDGVAVPTCECEHGWKGLRCDETDCRALCKFGFCRDPGKAFSPSETPRHLDFISQDECLCDLGWEGTWCDKPAPLCIIGEDSCGAGTCGINNICDCPQGYFGQRCELSICDDACENDGVCEILTNDNGPATYKCNCPEYATGAQCEKSPCDDLKCKNGGICELDEVGRPFCTCPDLWVGEFCEKDTAQHQCRIEALEGVMEPEEGCNFQPICNYEERMADYITIETVKNGFSLGMDKNKTHDWALMIRMTVDEALTNSYSVLGPARISQLFKDTETEYAPKIYEIVLEPTSAIYDDVMIYVSGFSNEDLLNAEFFLFPDKTEYRACFPTVDWGENFNRVWVARKANVTPSFKYRDFGF